MVEPNATAVAPPNRRSTHRVPRARAAAAVALAGIAACGGVQRPAVRVPAAVKSARAEPPAGATPRAEPPAAPRVYRFEPMRIDVVTDDTGAERVVAYDAGDLLDAGNEALAGGRADEALRYYDQLLADFPDSALVPAALFNAGLAHEQRREWDRAIARYRELAESPAARAADAIDGALRLAAVLAELERWGEATAALERLLARDDLSDGARIEALARLGYVLIESGDYPGAEDVLRSALAYYDDIRDRVVLDTDYYVAMCHYYLAQIPHREFLAIPIRLPDKQTKRDLDAKADRLLIAYDRYLATVEVGNPYWASAAGYQLASMYKQYWDALVRAPIPPRLGPEAADLYVKEVHRLSRQFLDKALAAHQKNASLEDRGIRTVWTEASREQVAVITDILAREAAGELVVPEAGDAAAPAPRLDPDAGTAAVDYVPGRVDL
ncbi:MAG: hypothetical protein D6689_20630 [Deltaproteobacteria bacterium]|nr:MAG: hypothetical protein D6689_20630 [Deltaproteobacteria bacterium]